MTAARDVAETVAGLVASHAAGLALMALLAAAQARGALEPGALALYPPLAALIGASAVAAISRAAGLALLGSWGPREAALEAAGLAGAALLAAAVAAPLSLPGSWPEWSGAAAISALMAASAALPLLLAAGRAAALPVSLDNVAPGVATSLVDLAVLGGLVALSAAPGGGLPWLLTAWLGLSLLMALRRLGYSPAGAGPAILGVLALEAATGRVLSGGYQLLAAASLLHVVPPVLKTAGGAAASSAARSSSAALLGGPEAVEPHWEALKAAASSAPSGVIIGVAGALASPGSPLAPLLAAPLVTPVTAFAAGLLASLSVRLGAGRLDPDRSVVPLTTAAADLAGAVLLVAAAAWLS